MSAAEASPQLFHATHHVPATPTRPELRLVTDLESIPGITSQGEFSVFPMTRATGNRLAKYVDDYGEKILANAGVVYDTSRSSSDVVHTTATRLAQLGVAASSLQEPRVVAPRSFVTEPVEIAEQRLDDYAAEHAIEGLAAKLVLESVKYAAQDDSMPALEQTMAGHLLEEIKPDQTTFHLL